MIFKKKLEVTAPFPQIDLINMMEELFEKMVLMIRRLVHFLEIRLLSRLEQEIDFCNVYEYQKRDEDFKVINDSNATLFISGNITNHDKNLEAIYYDCHGSMFPIGPLNFYLIQSFQSITVHPQPQFLKNPNPACTIKLSYVIKCLINQSNRTYKKHTIGDGGSSVASKQTI